LAGARDDTIMTLLYPYIQHKENRKGGIVYLKWGKRQEMNNSVSDAL